MVCLSGHKWNGRYCSVCGYSIEINSNTDLGILLDIAICRAPSGDTQAVMNQINDQDSLEFVAKNSKNHQAVRLAISKLKNQELLASFAKKGFSAAMQKLTDQYVLADIVKEIRNEGYVRKMAVNSLTDRFILAEIANSVDEDKYVYKEEAHSYGFEGSDGAQYAVNYNETITVDLRKVAEDRLKDI